MRAVISTIVIAGAALLGACTSNESSTNVTNTTEVPVENVTTTDTMVTNIDAAAPVDNGTSLDANASGAEAGNDTAGNAM